MMAGGGVILIVGVLVAVVAMVAVLRHNSGPGGQPMSLSPRELLAQRYARGEIDDDEYFQRLSVLESAGSAELPDRQRR